MVMITRLPSIQPQWASMERIWIENGCLKSSSMQVYRRWIQRFFDYCHTRTLDVTSQLTHAGAAAFAQWYAKQYGIHDDTACSSTCSALHAWALACTVLGERVPDWSPTTMPSAPADPLLVAFAKYLDEQCGNRLVTQRKKVAHCAKLLAFPGAHNNDIAQLRLQDLDAFVMECGQHYGRTTLADLCSSLRSFLRFLHATGRLESDLAPSVMSPIVRRGRRPLRALPWRQVCQLLAAIDRSTPA